MQVFGLLSLLITLALGAWLAVTYMVPPNSDEAGDSSDSSYIDAIDEAKRAADLLEGKNPSVISVAVYDGISVPETATELDLSGRGLSGSLKAEVRQLSKLQVLDVSDNQFTGLPAEVGQLSELLVLNLSNNPLTGLPHELGNLKKLQTLDLRGTNYAPYDLEIIKTTLSADVFVLVD